MRSYASWDLRLFFSRSITSSTPEPILIGDKNIGDGYTVTNDEKSPVIKIEFNSYIGYPVRNSRYLDFIRAGTIASEDYPGSFKYYSVSCLNHIVDVVSTEEPVVIEVGRE